jgi:hypothetical protein
MERLEDEDLHIKRVRFGTMKVDAESPSADYLLKESSMIDNLDDACRLNPVTGQAAHAIDRARF